MGSAGVNSDDWWLVTGDGGYLRGHCERLEEFRGEGCGLWGGGQVRRSSEMGRKGVRPPCFAKSGEVVWNQRVAEGLKIRVCRRVKRKGLRTCVNGRKRFAVRRGRSSSRTRITRGRVLVNDDLLDGNSNARGKSSAVRKRSVCPQVSQVSQVSKFPMQPR